MAAPALRRVSSPCECIRVDAVGHKVLFRRRRTYQIWGEVRCLQAAFRSPHDSTISRDKSLSQLMVTFWPTRTVTLNGNILPLKVGVQRRQFPSSSSFSGRIWPPLSSWQPCVSRTLCHTGIGIWTFLFSLSISTSLHLAQYARPIDFRRTPHEGQYHFRYGKAVALP